MPGLCLASRAGAHTRVRVRASNSPPGQHTCHQVNAVNMDGRVRVCRHKRRQPPVNTRSMYVLTQTTRKQGCVCVPMCPCLPGVPVFTEVLGRQGHRSGTFDPTFPVPVVVCIRIPTHKFRGSVVEGCGVVWRGCRPCWADRDGGWVLEPGWLSPPPGRRAKFLRGYVVSESDERTTS